MESVLLRFTAGDHYDAFNKSIVRLVRRHLSGGAYWLHLCSRSGEQYEVSIVSWFIGVGHRTRGRQAYGPGYKHCGRGKRRTLQRGFSRREAESQRCPDVLHGLRERVDLLAGVSDV